MATTSTSKWDLTNWKKGSVKFFDALGLKGATYPALSPTLFPAIAAATPAPSQSTTSASQTAAAGGTGKAGFKNPVGSWARPERIDMGVDYGGSGPLYAIGNGTITNVYNSGWPGGIFIGLKLDATGQYVYYAENISPQVRVNQKVTAGQLIGYATGGQYGIELGWAAPPGTGETMAASTGQSQLGQSQGDPGKYPTGYGVAFSKFISALGAPAGVNSGSVQGSAPASYS